MKTKHMNATKAVRLIASLCAILLMASILLALPVSAAEGEITVKMSDRSVLLPIGEEPSFAYTITVEGEMEADIAAKITYTVNGTAWNGTTEPGVYQIVATLPTVPGVTFVDAEGNTVTTLSATLTVQEQLVHAGEGIYVNAESGIPYTAVISASATNRINADSVKDFEVYAAYALTVTGMGNNIPYTVKIQAPDELYNENSAALTAADLYIYNATTGELSPVNVNNQYAVSLDSGVYTIAVTGGDMNLTLVMAPESTVFFLNTPLGIGLIVLVLLILLVVLLVIVLRKKGEEAAEEAVEEEETAEEAPVEDAAEEETVEEPVEETAEEEVAEETATEELAETVAEDLEEETEAPVEEEAEPEVDAELEEAVDETVEELLAEEEEVAEEPVEEPAEEEETVPAVVIVAENEEEEEEVEEPEEEETPFDFDGDLKFIDVKNEPEAYEELLAQEAAGEVTLVYRYRKSFQSKLAQSQGNTQDYYNLIKNALLSYKGVKARTSWNYEAFNKGRTHVAKIIAKTKTLYLYLALDPEEWKETKYGIVDVSDKKKYATVPVLMKIKGDRKFKYAMELIAVLCGEKLALPQTGAEEVDYRIPYGTNDELVEAGIIRKLAAGIPTAPVAEEETAVEEEAVAEEEEIIAIPVEEAPAVEAAAEAIESEEAAADETVSE